MKTPKIENQRKSDAQSNIGALMREMEVLKSLRECDNGLQLPNTQNHIIDIIAKYIFSSKLTNNLFLFN